MSSDADIRVVCLGTGTSHGVPMIGCDCATCTSDDPRDKRNRPALAVSWGETTVLVDTPPELRLACVAHRVVRADAILFTHHHADHVTGLDDVRRFNWINRAVLACYGPPATMERIRRMFAYAFEDDPDYPSHKPELRLIPIDAGVPTEAGERDDQPAPTGSVDRNLSPGQRESLPSPDRATTGQTPPGLTLAGLTIVPIPLWHGAMPVYGYRFGRFAYCTDCNRIPDASLRLLEGLDVLILDALRLRPHPTHFNLEQAIEMAARIGAGRTYFTHIAHEIRHEPVNARLPKGMALAYDGLTFEVGR